jgi:hypothetical protein
LKKWIIVSIVGLFLVVVTAISIGSPSEYSFKERLFNMPTESELNYIATKTPPSSLERANRAFDEWWKLFWK